MHACYVKVLNGLQSRLGFYLNVPYDIQVWTENSHLSWSLQPNDHEYHFLTHCSNHEQSGFLAGFMIHQLSWRSPRRQPTDIYSIEKVYFVHPVCGWVSTISSIIEKCTCSGTRVAYSHTSDYKEWDKLCDFRPSFYNSKSRDIQLVSLKHL